MTDNPPADLDLPRHGETALLDAARSYVKQAVEDGDANALQELRSRAASIEQYWARRRAGKEKADEYGEIKVRAERGIGQIDLDTSPHGGKRTAGQDGIPPNLMPEAHTRAAWRKLAPVSDERFEQLIADARMDEESGVSTARLIQILRFGSSMNSTTFECYTPAEYVEAARAVLGGIDLDPASSHEANKTIQADTIYTAADDGLAQSWHGRVWLNPPYGRGLTSTFVSKLVREYDAGNVKAGITVINAYGFDAAWFQPLFGHVLCFTDHRIKFYGGGPTFGSLFAYLGADQSRFAEVFSQFGQVVRRWP